MITTTATEVLHTAALPGIDPDKCLRRNRVSAKRWGQDTVRIKFAAEAPAPTEPGAILVETLGVLPNNDEEALHQINLRLGDQPLFLEDIYIHYGEAANNSFIDDRFMFLDETTLRNIAVGAEQGVAFMNSHRDGGLSAPAELPYGRTFAGSYQKIRHPDGRLEQRALFGVYFQKGIYPNGPTGPSTDTLDQQIRAGILTDVSVGIYGGWARCDVCGLNVEDTDCPHIPGTHRGMDPEQATAQLSRGVARGYASYTRIDSGLGEISGVFKGAVRGAGFRKANKFASQLTEKDIDEVLNSYADLVEDSDFTGGIIERLATAVAEKLQGLRPGRDEADPEPIRFTDRLGHVDNLIEEPTEGDETMDPVQAPTPSAVALRDDQGAVAETLSQMRAEMERLVAERDHFKAQADQTRADVAGLVKARQLDKFRSQVGGSDGARWFGDIDANAEALYSLHSHPDFGPEHPTTRLFVEANRSLAAHLETSDVYQRKGSSRRNGTGSDAILEVNRRVATLKAEQGLDERDAFARVFDEDPAAYDRYRKSAYTVLNDDQE